jgi:hypothetical protein
MVSLGQQEFKELKALLDLLVLKVRKGHREQLALPAR